MTIESRKQWRKSFSGRNVMRLARKKYRRSIKKQHEKDCNCSICVHKRNNPDCTCNHCKSYDEKFED